MTTAGVGSVCQLTAIFQDSTGTAVTPITPLVTILDPLSTPLLTDQVPTFTGSTGRYFLDFTVPLLGPLGSWTAVWSGLINSVSIEASEVFTVVEPGDIIFPPDVFSPCGPWPVDLSCVQGLPDDLDPGLLAKWQQVATDRLWTRSGRRFGICSRTIRPCAKRCAADYGFMWGVGAWQLQPYILNGNWFNVNPCRCSNDCSCGSLSEVFLPGPVHLIESVLIDGALLDADAYRVDAPGWLVRQDGGEWPHCQNLGAPDSEPHTFSVTYEYGLPLTEAAKAAVSSYTAELVKACLPDCDCRLPRSPADIETFLEKGLTGLMEVDQWLTDVNPDNLPAQPRVMSPDSGFLYPRVQMWP